MLYLPALGLAFGVLVGYLVTYNVPPAYARYLSIAVLAALDSGLGGVRAMLEHTFDDRLFITGFVSNTILATLITFMGDRLGVSLYLAAVIAFGVRLFRNLAIIRRLVLK
jgi:small basic protein